MLKARWFVLLTCAASPALAQDFGTPPSPVMTEPGYADAFLGAASVGSNEPLFYYDDQEPWKHGYIQAMPFYGGYRSFLPYNYHNVFGQSQTAAGWGMSPTLPYSQQFWHKYEHLVDLSQGDHSPLTPYERPIQEWDHYPKPIGPNGAVPPAPSYPSDANSTFYMTAPSATPVGFEAQVARPLPVDSNPSELPARPNFLRGL